MNWKLIKKDPQTQPKNGTYSDWKEQIAQECFHQCVYCSIHEAQFGGINNYHIDHFRPKSLFRDLENDICNLFYACPICNRFKNKDWPAEPDLNVASYPDPSKNNYSDLFSLTNDFEVEGIFVASRYLVLRLFLNRAQLIMERREEKKRKEVSELVGKLTHLIDNISDFESKLKIEAYKELTAVQVKIQKLYDERNKIRPYALKDIKKN